MTQTPPSPRAVHRSFLSPEPTDSMVTPTLSGTLPEASLTVTTNSEPKTSRRGRKKLWVPAMLSDADRARAAALLKKYGISVSSKDRILVDYRTFCIINHLAVKAGLGDCVGQMSEKLRIGTVDTYSAFVAAEYPSQQHRKVRKAVQRAHADEDVEGAPRFLRTHLQRLVEKMVEPLMHRFCLLLLLLGIRPVAGRRLRRRNFGVNNITNAHAVVVGIAWDKTVGKRSTRQHLKLPRWLAMDTSQEELFKIMGSGDPGETPFADVTCAAVNEALRAAWAEDKGSTMNPPTSYSFRRAYVQAVFENYDGDGEALKKYTLHFGDQVVKAHYVDWFAHCEKVPGTEVASMLELPSEAQLEDAATEMHL